MAVHDVDLRPFEIFYYYVIHSGVYGELGQWMFDVLIDIRHIQEMYTIKLKSETQLNTFCFVCVSFTDPFVILYTQVCMVNWVNGCLMDVSLKQS